MVAYHLIYVTRSDGQLEATVRGVREVNRPTDEQMLSTPDKDGNIDYYAKLPANDTKELDWRRKLGGMLMREKGGAEAAGKNYILAEFPKNYELFEHIKQTPNGSKSHKAGRSHAKGSSDRQDAYLYGHPHGRKKRYRSPHDFFPHLLWLLTDKDNDPNNCACKFCSPDGNPTEKHATVAKAKSEPKPKPEPAKKEEVKKDTPAPEAKPKTLVPSVPAAPTPTPLPQLYMTGQQLDWQYRSFSYRSGELVWFSRGTAWGLGVITTRDYTQGKRYQVQPLSHPFVHPEALTVTSESLFRPWLAWTPPPLTHEALQVPDIYYDAVHWEGIVNGAFGPGDPEVDGSILAARKIDSIYTPFGEISRNNQQRTYVGTYFGGEKIWTGDPVRLRLRGSTESTVMVVNTIMERIQPDPNPTAMASWVVSFIGDIFALSTASGQLPDDSFLPDRMRQDLRFRNEASTRAGRHLSYWKLIQPRASVQLQDVKGRWYESSIFLPILLAPDVWQNTLATGNLGDAGSTMNGRCDKMDNKVGFRVGTRREAFGLAVPPNCFINDDS